MNISPQRIEIDLTGTGRVTVFHDVEVMVGGKAVQVMNESKDEKGRVVKLQPTTTFNACPRLLAVVEEIATAVKEGREFVFPENEALLKLAEAQKDRKPKPIEKPVKVEAVAEVAAPEAQELYPDEPVGVEGGE